MGSDEVLDEWLNTYRTIGLIRQERSGYSFNLPPQLSLLEK